MAQTAPWRRHGACPAPSDPLQGAHGRPALRAQAVAAPARGLSPAGEGWAGRRRAGRWRPAGPAPMITLIASGGLADESSAGAPALRKALPARVRQVSGPAIWRSARPLRDGRLRAGGQDAVPGCARAPAPESRLAPTTWPRASAAVTLTGTPVAAPPRGPPGGRHGGQPFRDENLTGRPGPSGRDHRREATGARRAAGK